MHELTLLYGVAQQVEKVCDENNIDHVDAIVVEVGEVTGVVPEFLLDGYEVISDDFDFLRGSELIVNVIESIGRCMNCGREFPIVENQGVCPDCGSIEKEVLTGLEFNIKEVRLYE